MDILDEETKTRMAFKKIKNLKGEKLKQNLIKLNLKYKKELEKSYIKIKVQGKPLIELDNFSSKFDKSKSFWDEMWKITKGKVNIDINNSIVIPNKILHLQDILNKFHNKLLFTKEEIIEIHNGYKLAFETVLKIIYPFFENVLGKKEDGNYLYWSDIYKSIQNLNREYLSLFKSMNGQLRDAEGHVSTYIDNNKFIWIKENGERSEYSPNKILDKVEDLFFLIIALSRSLNEIYLGNLIEAYKKIPSLELEKIYKNISI